MEALELKSQTLEEVAFLSGNLFLICNIKSVQLRRGKTDFATRLPAFFARLEVSSSIFGCARELE
jgi:hypothetical protein